MIKTESALLHRGAVAAVAVLAKNWLDVAREVNLAVTASR